MGSISVNMTINVITKKRDDSGIESVSPIRSGAQIAT